MSSYLMIFVFKMGNEKKLEDDSIFVYIEHHTTFILETQPNFRNSIQEGNIAVVISSLCGK